MTVSKSLQNLVGCGKLSRLQDGIVCRAPRRLALIYPMIGPCATALVSNVPTIDPTDLAFILFVPYGTSYPQAILCNPSQVIGSTGGSRDVGGWTESGLPMNRRLRAAGNVDVMTDPALWPGGEDETATITSQMYHLLDH
jgi:hypothetical protein